MSSGPSVTFGQLPPGMTEETVRSVYGAYCFINEVVMVPPTSCTITVNTQDDANWLVENLNGQIPQGLSAPVSVTHGGSTAIQPWGGAPGGGAGGAAMGMPQSGMGAGAGMGNGGWGTDGGMGGGMGKAPYGKGGGKCGGKDGKGKGKGKGGYGMDGGSDGGCGGGCGGGGGGGGNDMMGQMMTMMGGMMCQMMSMMTTQPNGGGGGGGYGPAQSNFSKSNPPVSKNVFVGNLPQGVDEPQALALFSKYGQIVTIKVLAGNSSSGAVILSFQTEEEAAGLVADNGKTPEGLQRPIKAVYKTPTARGPSGSNMSNMNQMGTGCGGSWGPY